MLSHEYNYILNRICQHKRLKFKISLSASIVFSSLKTIISRRYESLITLLVYDLNLNKSLAMVDKLNPTSIQEIVCEPT